MPFSITMRAALALVFLLPATALPEDSKLVQNCSKPEYACGECEGALQDEFNKILAEISGGQLSADEHWSKFQTNGSSLKEGITLENTLQKITDLFRQNNSAGGNMLNMIVFGQSGSKQKAHPGSPRIAVKSPNSEIWVTFNTDPKSEGYNQLEIMRWNGKAGKFEFQEIEFASQNKKGHLDTSGSKCIECHKSPPRPNWDTYRSWAGVLPARDDFLEAEENTGNSKPDVASRAYIDLLKSISMEKERSKKTGRPSRLSVLDIPYEPRYLSVTPRAPVNDSEKIGLIEKQISEKGWYRVPHFPPKDKLLNYSDKTAAEAGPAHTAFDQLMGQQMCQASMTMKNHPDWEKLKYLMAGILFCGSVGLDQIQPYFNDNQVPESLATKIRNHWRSLSSSENLGEVYESVFNNTQTNHSNRDIYKTDRHKNMIESFLLNEDPNMPKEKVEEISTKIARSQTISVGSPYTAIGDPGGVKGVKEFHTSEVSTYRFLLEPLGVPVGTWSMTVGKDNTDVSYAFSDQFKDTMKEQKALKEVWEEAGKDCETLKSKSREAMRAFGGPLSPPLPNPVPPEKLISDCFDYLARTRALEGFPSIAGLVASFAPVAQSSMGPAARHLMKRCLECHSPETMPVLKLAQAGENVSPELLEQARSWLNQNHSQGGSWMEHMDQAINSSTDNRPSMPPGGWDPTKPNSDDEREKKELLTAYLRTLSMGKGKGNDRLDCRSISSALKLRPEATAPMKPAQGGAVGEPTQ